MTVLASQVSTKTIRIISVQTIAKRSLKKIHRNIHGQPVISVLNLAERRAENRNKKFSDLFG